MHLQKNKKGKENNKAIRAIAILEEKERDSVSECLFFSYFFLSSDTILLNINNINT